MQAQNVFRTRSRKGQDHVAVVAARRTPSGLYGLDNDEVSAGFPEDAGRRTTPYKRADHHHVSVDGLIELR
jgi:hypothetical protein